MLIFPPRLLPNWMQQAPIRWLITLLWTAFFAIVLVQSTASPIINIGLQAEPVSWEREIFFGTLHFLGYIGTTLLWWWALGQTASAVWIAMLVCVPLGLLTEYLQTISPDRDANIWDAGINMLGILVAVWAIRRWWLKDKI